MSLTRSAGGETDTWGVWDQPWRPIGRIAIAALMSFAAVVAAARAANATLKDSSRMERALLRILCIVLACISLIAVARRVGMPAAFSRLPAVGPFLTRAVGMRLVLKSPDGRVASREIFRGRGYIYDYLGVYVHHPYLYTDDGALPPLVNGTYFDPEGRVVSRVHDGTGVRVHFFTNHVPSQIDIFRDGTKCGSQIQWYPTGQLLYHCFTDEEGRLHGRARAFTGRGELVRENVLEHGKHQQSTRWYPDGGVHRSCVWSAPEAWRELVYDTNGRLYADGEWRDARRADGTFTWQDYTVDPTDYTMGTWREWILVYSNGVEVSRYPVSNSVPARFIRQ